MNRRNRVAFFNILSTILLRGISIFTAPLFTRLLGTSGYGVTQIYNTWVAVIAIVFTLQTQGTLVNARVEYPEGEQLRYQSSAMGLSTLVYLIFSVLVLCFIGPISGALKLDRFLIVLMLIQAFGTFCVNFLNTKFVYEFKAGRNMVMSLAVTLTTLILSVVLVLNLPKEINYLGRIGAIAATYGILGIPVCIWILAKGKTFYRRDYWKFCIALGLPLTFQSLAYYLLGNSDVVMLRQMAGANDSGIYSLAFSVSGILFTLYNALNSSWVPFFFDDMRTGRRENIVRQSGRYLELYTVLSVGFILLVPEVFRFFMEESFWQGIVLLPIFAANYYGNVLCTFPVNYEIHYKKTGAVTLGTVVAALCNLLLNYVMIHAWGMVGAAIATLLARLIQLAMHQIYARRILGKSDYPFPRGPELGGIAGLTLAIVLFYLTPNAWFIRWPLAAAVGIWELLRIWKRRSLL